MEDKMNTVTFSIASRDEMNRRVMAAFRGKTQGNHISFASVELLWRTLTKHRWEILQSMIGEGELSIREVARRVGRDVKGVHGDVHALIDAGVIERDNNRVV